jgi:hypothetical protein
MRMKIRIILVAGLMALSGSSTVLVEEPAFPVLSGPYLGQEPPGTSPELSAPSIITRTDRNEPDSVFSPGGDEFYFAVYTPEPINTCVIMVSRLIGGAWSRPEAATFSGQGIDVDMAFALPVLLDRQLSVCELCSTIDALNELTGQRL